MSNLIERVLVAALVLFASAWLLTRAWQMARPLVPMLVVALLALTTFRLVRNRNSRW